MYSLQRVTTKGKATCHPTMQPWAHKVTWVASPKPEAMAPTTPVAGLSRQDHPALFVDPIASGDEGIGGGMAETSGESSCTYVRVLTDLGSIAFGTPVLLKFKLDAITTDGAPLPSQPSPPQHPSYLGVNATMTLWTECAPSFRLGLDDWMPCAAPS